MVRVQNKYLIGLSLPFALTPQDRVIAANSMFRIPHPPFLRCPLCKKEVTFRMTEDRRPHFSHHPGEGMHSEEEICHNLTVLLMEEKIKDDIAAGNPTATNIKCEVCGKYHKRDILKEPPVKVLREKNFVGIRPDLLLLGLNDKPLLAVEVVVAHAIEEGTLKVYQNHSIPVIEHIAAPYNNFSSFYIKKSSGYTPRRDWTKYRHFLEETTRLITDNSYTFSCDIAEDLQRRNLAPIRIEHICGKVRQVGGEVSFQWQTLENSLDIIRVDGREYWFNLSDLSKQVDIKKRIKNDTGFSWFIVFYQTPFVLDFNFKGKILTCKEYVSSGNTKARRACRR